MAVISRTFHVRKDPYEKGEELFSKCNISINEGLTVLVGCNGSGKSTLLSVIKKELKDKGISVLSYDNLHQGGSNSVSEMMFHGNIDMAASLMCGSEGETIDRNLGITAQKCGACMRKALERGEKEFWLLLDAIDSGLSIDNVTDLKDFFQMLIDDGKAHGVDVYIVASANAFELAKDSDCLNVSNGRYRRFKTYDSYRKFIMKSREDKDKRFS